MEFHAKRHDVAAPTTGKTTGIAALAVNAKRRVTIAMEWASCLRVSATLDQGLKPLRIETQRVYARFNLRDRRAV